MEQSDRETTDESPDDEKFYDCSDECESVLSASTSKNDGIGNEPSLSKLTLSENNDEIDRSEATESTDDLIKSQNEFIGEKYFIDEESMKRREIDAGVSFNADDRKNEAIRLKAQGNDSFKLAHYEQAAEIYTNALKTCPVTSCADLRAVLYSNRAVCFSKMDLTDEAIADCSSAIAYDATYIKPLMRRAQLYEDKDSLDKALEDYEAILRQDPSNAAARGNVMRLGPIVQERNEKLKQEMIGKLKDLGNVFLRPFGLSTDNFQLQPNESGGYSVKMQK